MGDLVDGFSGISLGTGSGVSQRIACYEIPTSGGVFNQGHFFYGHGLFEGGSNSLSTGIGIWGGTGNNPPDQFGNGNGVLPHMLINYNGNVGIGNAAPTEKLHVTGNILATGSISGATKSFDIPHESKPGMRLLHWCTESDSPGGNLIYKRQIEAYEEGVNKLIMPEWFSWVAKNIVIMCSGEKTLRTMLGGM